MCLPPQPSREPVEPFPWMSAGRMEGRYKFSLRSPISEAVFGGFLLIAGLVFAVVLFGRGEGGADALGVLLLVVFDGLGVLLLVMAAARGRWVRAYRRMHGRKPF